MKKVLAICLAMVMMVSMGITAFAAPNGFISSPSGTPGPGIITFDPGDNDWFEDLFITTYPDREDLPESLRDLFETAYNSLINNAGNFSQLVEGLADILDRLNIDGNFLAISDFFVLHAGGTDYFSDSDFQVTLDASDLENFVGLIQMNENGKWELVTNAQIVNGNQLQFTSNSFAPYAILVDSSAGSLIAPQTGYTVACICAVLMVASAVALCVIFLKRKKAAA